MTDPAAASPHRLRWLLVPALILATAVLAWQALRSHRAQMQQIDQLALDVRRLEAQNAEAARNALQGRTGLETLSPRVLALEQDSVRLARTLDQGRLRAQASAADLLLTAAAERVQFDRDPVAAARLLEWADRRLADAADARLSPVRKALAEERVALLSVPVVDREGLALRLAALIQQSAQWPLQHAARAAHAAAVPVEMPTASGWVQQVWASMRVALSGMFSLRRDDDRLRRTLGPEQETLLRQLLLLRLEGARLALMRGDAAAFADLCRSAATLLAEDFHGADAAVRAATTQLREWSALALDAPLPALGRAQALLRQWLELNP